MPTMYAPDTVLHVPPFQHRLEGDTVSIGDTNRNVFLSLPQSGLGILQDLAAGHTVGETSRRYEERTGRQVDIDGFVGALEAEGFVRQVGAAPVEAAAAEPDRFVGHLSWISTRTARRIVGPPVVILALALLAGMVALVATDPGVVPGFQALIYPHHLAMLTWITFAIGFTATMLHEFAHVIAARAAGVPSRIRLSNRMFIPVIETDMTGIWLAPKRARYLAFLAGALLDSASLALFIAVLFAERRGWVSFSPTTLLLLNGVAVTYIGRIYWQGFLFVRTDLYYTVATAFGCKDLMTDTQHFIENALRRVTGRKRLWDQSGLPRRERRVVWGFSVFWLIGRAMALLLLVSVTIPVLWHYLSTIYDFLTNPSTIWTSFDFVTSVLLSTAVTGTGLVLWGRALARGIASRVAARRGARPQPSPA